MNQLPIYQKSIVFCTKTDQTYPYNVQAILGDTTLKQVPLFFEAK
jgi:hypothetical protein